MPLSSAWFSVIACDVSKRCFYFILFLLLVAHDNICTILIEHVRFFRKERVIPVHNNKIYDSSAFKSEVVKQSRREEALI